MTKSGNPTKDQPAGLPDDLAERLNTLARAQTASSRPWPAVDQALRRAHRRRISGIAAVAAASVLVAGTVIGVGLSAPHLNRSAAPPAASSAPTATVKNLVPTDVGYTHTTSGPLKSDDDWINGVQLRIVELTGIEYGAGESMNSLDVYVLWAGDVGSTRYASVLYHSVRPEHVTDDANRWTRAILTGPAGASPEQMRIQPSVSNSEVPVEPEVVFFSAPTASSAGLALVTAPKARSVKIATARTSGADRADGERVTSWRSLTKQGSVTWVGELSAQELALASYQVDGKIGVIVPWGH